jgi:hypothetical protein
VKKMFGICGLMTLMVLPVDGGQRLTMTVAPAKSFAPANLRVRAWIDPNIDNRSLAIVADGEDFYRSSEIPLPGDHAPKIIEMWFPNVPGGEYAVYAVLRDASGRERAIARESVTVLSQLGQ